MVFACALSGVSVEARAQLAHEDCQEPSEWARTCEITADCNTGLICIRDAGLTTGTCRIPCEADGEPEPASCAYGEACVPGEELGVRSTLYCKPVPFTMDLNLLDSCVYHFIEGLQPVGASDSNVCSLAANLARMLERDGTPGFGIYDVDQCIQDFLDQAPVDPCPGGDCLYCQSDAECGEGSFCNLDLRRCERECGRIVDRGSEGAGILERECSGRMKVCNEGRGRCDDFVLGGNTCDSFRDCPRGGDCVAGVCELVPAKCEVDNDCPTGAYCFLGECQPRCFRSLECPDSNWFCSGENKCQRKPPPSQEAGFEPSRYSILFGIQSVAIDGVNNRQDLPLLIMDTDSGRAVFGNGNILFGYRLQVTYGRKQDPLCLGDLERPELTDGQRADCVISPREEFLVLENPFGTVYGDGRQAITVHLNDTAAQSLTPGQYVATVRALFSNGSATTMTIRYNKPTPDGRYGGPLRIAVDDPNANLVAVTDASLGLRIHRDEERTWEELLDENHVIDLASDSVGELEFHDITFGYLVEGAIYGNDALVFDNPNATTDKGNEIAIRGLYSPQYRRMRLLSIVDTPANAEWCRDGSCTLSSSDDEQLRVRNVFGRDVRRRIEWIGTFDDVTRRFEGIYRETLTGLFPYDVTLQGEFELAQIQQDSTLSFVHGPYTEPLLPLDGWLTTPFPDRATLFSKHEAAISSVCAGTTAIDNDLDAAEAFFDGKGRFLDYIGNLDEDSAAGGGPFFASISELGGRVGGALDKTGDIGEAAVSIADLLRDSVKRCADDPTADICVDVDALVCGLALHTKALLAGEEYTETAQECTRTDQCPSGVCVYDPVTATGRCRGVCSGLDASQCSASEVCVSGMTVEGNATDLCEPTFGGWVNRGAIAEELTTGTGDQTHVSLATLFCDRRAAVADPNCESSAAAPDVAALQEYIWFYKNLHEIYAFEAGQEVSDAFFQLYRDEYITGTNALDLTKAYKDKVTHLKNALARYDDAGAQMFDPATAQVLFDWPMGSFETQGEAWLTQMHAVLNDRADALYELVDLQRRVLRENMTHDSLFYNHVFQQEYLAQVFLAVLQAHWQGPQFLYSGQGPKALSKASQILRRVDEVNNPLGLRPDRTYFENGWNSGVQSNVELFRLRAATKLEDLIGPDGRGGLIGFSKDALRAALQTEQQLIADLDALKDQLDAELLRICGDDTPPPSGCAELTGLERTLQTSCVGQDCPITFQCDDPRCGRVSRLFTDTLDGTLEEVACRADTPLYRIYKNPLESTGGGLGQFLNEDDLESRLCVRGEVGALLQERASLELSRQDTLRKVNDLIRQLAIKDELIGKVGTNSAEVAAFLAGHRVGMEAIEAAFTTADVADAEAEATAFGSSCMVIAGPGAAGDNCLTMSVTATALSTAKTAKATAGGAYRTAVAAADILKTIALEGFEADSRVSAIKSEMDSLASQIESHIGQYQMVIQQMQAVDIQTMDALTIAQSRWTSYSDEVQEVAARLTGQDSRWALLRNSAAMSAQRRFRGLLLDLYKLVQAVGYRYDLPAGEVRALRNEVYKIVTAGQVTGFLDDLDCRLQQFAVANQLDPDWNDPANSTVFVMSLRDQLFPTLTDIVDPDTGAVLTADEQFHRILTSPPYLRTVVVDDVSEQRIIVPFATWMDVRASSLVGRPALVNRHTCNHVLVGDAERQSAVVNFEVWNPRTDQQGKEVVHSWLGRGTIDHMRSCSDQYENSNAPVVNPYTFGNAYRDSDVPLPNLETRFEACIGAHDVLTGTDEAAMQNLTCWKNAFRERTFGSPGWVLEIDALGPLEDNWWILHAPSDEAAPVIRDIDIAFRYTDRAMGNTTFQCQSP